MASSSFSRKRKYDVFLSFRGDDTRSNILSHVRRCLDNKNIVNFKDDEMERGEEIGPSLKDAIESSTIALVIISKSYASSRWCLDELLHILECKEKHGLKVFPIFFHVDPSHVRNPTTGVFAAHFTKHKETFDDLVVEKWISALTKIGNFSGFPLENGSEVDLLDKVIEVILQNVEPLPSINAKELVGIGTHVRKLESLMGDDTQCFIGITGMGGVGKTTIARLIFDIFRGNFEGAIFLSVAEVLGRSDEGNIDLTKTFLSALMEKEVIVSSPFVRHSPHARWLFNKKLLVVLDDVKFEQFQNLIGEFCSKGDNGTYHHEFGSGTKIILTSRNKQLLRQICGNGDKSIYEVEGLKYSDALQLFCRHAFGQNYPKEEFKNLVRPFIGYAGGNPLALKVLGSLLHGKTKEEWESFLKILGKNQDQDIYKILKISYDGLDENQKSVFLYIACYFDKVSSRTIDLLESCGWGATYGMRVLEDKCLLERSVFFDGRYFMHKLLREMGKQIVKQESKDPGKRLILWEPGDVRLVFSRTSESEAVEGITLSLNNEKEQIVLNPNDFAKVPCLKFLAFLGGHAECPHGLDYLPNELCLIDWTCYPLKSLPAQFQPTNLIELNLPDSNLEELWEGRKELRSLQSIDLRDSFYLKKLPNLSCASNLKMINLNNCGSLVELSSSMKHLHMLQRLDLSNCRNIRSLPSFIWKLKSLEKLNLEECLELENLSESTEFLDPSTSQPEIYGQLSPLKLLSIIGCRKIRFLPELPGKLLQKFDVSYCESLETSSFDLKQLFRFQRTLENLDDNYIDNIFIFTNCWKLDVRWADLAELAKKKIQATTVLRYFKTEYADPWCSNFCMCYPGCEIPKWIKHQNMGYSITLQIPVNERLLGFAICFVLSPCESFCEGFDYLFSFIFTNSSGNSFFWGPEVKWPLLPTYNDTEKKLENTVIYGIPLPANDHSEMIKEVASAGDYEITLKISHCRCGIKRPEDIKCGMIPLFVQNANGKQLETPLDETTKVIIKDIKGNLDICVDDHMVKNPDRNTISEMYKEVTTDINPEVNHQGILYCIWGNENCRKSNEVETFSWLNMGYLCSEDEDDGDNDDEDDGYGDDENEDDKHNQKNGDAQNLGDVEPRIIEELKSWKLPKIYETSQCWSLRLPDGLKVPKISRLAYTNSGHAILALASNTIHLLWKLRRDYSTGEKVWKPTRGNWMINEIGDTNPEESIPCFALVEDDSKLLSASGGKISIFKMKTLEKIKTLMSPPPAATYLAFDPVNHSIIAVGMDDSTILIYNIHADKVISQLKGHSRRVTGLAFSHELNVLVSSGADAQLCIWSSGEWKKQKDRLLEVPAWRRTAAQLDTHVQFHLDQIHFLVVHETQLAIYETRTLQRIKHWVPCESSAPISHATFSCDSQLVYACFLDATVCVFRTTNLSICSRIHSLSYLPANVSNVHPLVIAAHPLEPKQFALGLSDGGVCILQPLEFVGLWDVPAHAENDSTSCELTTPPLGPSGLDQEQIGCNFIDFMQLQTAASTSCELTTPSLGPSGLDQEQTGYNFTDFMQLQTAASTSCELTIPSLGPSGLDQEQTGYNFIDFMQLQTAAPAYDMETVILDNKQIDYNHLNFMQQLQTAVPTYDMETLTLDNVQMDSNPPNFMQQLQTPSQANDMETVALNNM